MKMSDETQLSDLKLGRALDRFHAAGCKTLRDLDLALKSNDVTLDGLGHATLQKIELAFKQAGKEPGWISLNETAPPAEGQSVAYSTSPDHFQWTKDALKHRILIELIRHGQHVYHEIEGIPMVVYQTNRIIKALENS